MKKFLAMILALCMVFALCACGQSAAPAQEPAAADAAPTEEAAAPAVDFPTKQISVICPYGAGGASDVISRLYAAGMETATGVSVIVENKTGAGGAVGFEATANAAADGYTLGYVSAEITTLKTLGNTDVAPEDFIFLGRVMQIPACVIVTKDSPFETLQDLIDAAKVEDAAVSVGTTNTGSFYHIGSLKLEQAAGVKFNNVPYAEGAASAIAALMGGEVDAATVGASECKSNVDSGEFRILAVLADERCATFPDAPTAKELGYDAVSSTWGAFVCPKGTPDEIVAILREATEAAINSEDMKNTLVERGFEHAYIPGAEFQTIAEQLTVDNAQIINDFDLAA